LSDAPGLLSDPFFIFNATLSDGTDAAKFSGTAVPDPDNAGRYTISPLGIVVAADPQNFTTVVYQAAGSQLIWLDENPNDRSVFLGSLQQQGSLTGIPAARRSGASAKSNRRAQ
jgi:hypothetical protein